MADVRFKLISLHDSDNVLVALSTVGPGEVSLAGGQVLPLSAQVTLGHKVASRPISEGELVVKYGMPIGTATEDIPAGAHVHVHNIASRYTATHYRDEEAGLSDE